MYILRVFGNMEPHGRRSITFTLRFHVTKSKISVIYTNTDKRMHIFQTSTRYLVNTTKSCNYEIIEIEKMSAKKMTKTM